MELIKLKCPKCGGDITVKPNQTIGVCSECDAILPLPKCYHNPQTDFGDPRVQSMIMKLNKAIEFSQEYQFHRSYNVYDKLIRASVNTEDPDFYPYWGKVLSQYGVIYTLDDRLENQIVCLRTSYESIFDNDNYRKAIEYSDHGTQVLLKKEALEIDSANKRVLKTLVASKPLDIVICVDDGAENSNRDIDLKLADSIREKLVDKYPSILVTKDFFKYPELVSLEEKLFPAIETCQVMIVVSSNTEHLDLGIFRNAWMNFYRRLEFKDTIQNHFIMVTDDATDYDAINRQQIIETKKEDWLHEVANLVDDCVSKPYTTQEVYPNVNFEVIDNLMAESKFLEAKGLLNRLVEDGDLDPKVWWRLYMCKHNVATEDELLKQVIDPREDYYYQQAYLRANRNEKRSYFAYLEKMLDSISKLSEVDEEYEAEVFALQKRLWLRQFFKTIVGFGSIILFSIFCFMTISLNNAVSALIGISGFIICYIFVLIRYIEIFNLGKLPADVVNDVDIKKYYYRIRTVLTPAQAAGLLPSTETKKLKNIAHILLLVCALLTIGFFVNESIITYENTNLRYYYLFDEVIITGGNSTTINITSKIGNRRVTKIADEAFVDDDDLEKVVINYGLTEIGSAAFKNCDKLKEVILPSSLIKVGDEAPFEGSNRLEYFAFPRGEIKESTLLGLKWQEKMPYIIIDGREEDIFK